MKNMNDFDLRWIFKKAKGTRVLFWFFVLSVIVNNLIFVSIAYFLKLFVDIATGDHNASLLYIGKIALITVSLGGLLSVFNSVLEKSFQRMMERNLDIELMSIIFTRRIIDISGHHTGELLAKMTDDVQAIGKCYVSIARNIIGNIVMVIAAVSGLFYLNWKMAVIMLLLSALMLLIKDIFNSRIKNISDIDRKNGEDIRSAILENLSRIMLVKTYFMHKNVAEKIRNAYAEKIITGQRLGAWEGLLSFFGILSSTVMFLVALGIGAYFVLSGETTVGSLVAMVQLLNFVIEPVSSIVKSFSNVSNAVVSAGRIGKLYELPPDRDMMIIPATNAIELAAIDVSFSYDNPGNSGNTSEILHKITARFQKGDITGIIGNNGNGTSTLMKILIGLYPPQEGRVELVHANGVLKGEAILSQVAYVPPANFLFSGTVVDNIVMSGEEIRLDDLRNALNDADIFEFVQSLQDGVDSLIEDGSGNISSDHAQRIAIARAIYKRAPIMVFDEPSANLDAESIAKLHSMIRKIARDKICIIVTHDISAMNICDKVYILDNGNLTERYCCRKLKAL